MPPAANSRGALLVPCADPADGEGQMRASCGMMEMVGNPTSYVGPCPPASVPARGSEFVSRLGAFSSRYGAFF
jgi:hypothetical protein